MTIFKCLVFCIFRSARHTFIYEQFLHAYCMRVHQHRFDKEGAVEWVGEPLTLACQSLALQKRLQLYLTANLNSQVFLGSHCGKAYAFLAAYFYSVINNGVLSHKKPLAKPYNDTIFFIEKVMRMHVQSLFVRLKIAGLNVALN